jgi:hypothetical protein
MLGIFGLALLLAPLVWFTQARQRLLSAELQAALAAREIALRSVVREEQRRQAEAVSAAQATVRNEPAAAHGDSPSAVEVTPTVERLRRENADLRQQLQQLRHDVEAFKNSPQPAPAPPR